MIQFTYLLFAFIPFLHFLQQPQQGDRMYLSPASKLVHEILHSTAEAIKTKYNLKPSGAGAAIPEGIVKELMLAFNTKEEVTRDQLRVLLFACAEELMKQTKTRSEIDLYLEKLPFTFKNMQIIIYNFDKEGREVYHPGIEVAEFSHGKLTYQTVDRADTFRYKAEYEESYEEALKIISKQGK